MLLDRTINVISLAGIALAIGMTIDNTIVVHESIQQERQQGKNRYQAARDGVLGVWTAVLSGTMTTVLVFLPLLFIREEAGQLFSDVGIAISSSILMSMLVAILVVPVIYAALPAGRDDPHATITSHRPPRMLSTLAWLFGGPGRRISCMAIVLFGLAFSTLVTLTFLPCLLVIFLDVG